MVKLLLETLATDFVITYSLKANAMKAMKPMKAMKAMKAKKAPTQATKAMKALKDKTVRDPAAQAVAVRDPAAEVATDPDYGFCSECGISHSRSWHGCIHNYWD